MIKEMIPLSFKFNYLKFLFWILINYNYRKKLSFDTEYSGVKHEQNDRDMEIDENHDTQKATEEKRNVKDECEQQESPKAGPSNQQLLQPIICKK